MAHQVIIIEKILKAFPKKYFIDIEQIRRILAVVNEIIACNEQNVATLQEEKK